MRSSQKTKWTDEEGAKKRIQMVGHRIPSQDRAPPQNTVIQGPEKENPNLLLTPLASSHSLMKTELENCKKEKKMCRSHQPWKCSGTSRRHHKSSRHARARTLPTQHLSHRHFSTPENDLCEAWDKISLISSSFSLQGRPYSI